MKATSVYFFPNGVKKGFNPEDIKEIHLPSGRVKLFKVDDGYNWENVKI